MSTPLLTTKLYIPPAPAQLILRPRLLRRLDAGLDVKLTLLSAAPGFGKTTLLSQWIQQKRLRVAWISLDAGDNDLRLFLSYLVAGLQGVDPEVGVSTRELLDTPQALPAESILTTLLNEISRRAERYVVVLDDFHAIEAPPVLAAVGFLLDHLPPHLHLILSGREDPPLALARLRVQNQLVEIRAADLRLTREETAQYLNAAMQLGLAPADLEALESRTEGWAAGLQMACLGLRARADRAEFIASFRGTQRFVMEYLTEQVLQRQPPRIRQFLLATSILPRLCAPLGEAVTGFPESAAILERLDRSNLFLVPLDEEERWYRYHPLFADHLRSRLEHEQPQAAAELHRKAGAWYAAHGEISPALDHALAGEDFETAARLLERAGGDLLATGGWGMLTHWLHRLPAEMLSRPQLALYLASAQVLTGRLQDVDQSLSAVERAVAQETLDAGTRLRWRGQMAAVKSRAAYLRGEAPRAIQEARAALELVPAEDRTTRGILAITLGSSLILEGELEEAGRVLAEAEGINRAAGNVLFAADASGSLGQIWEAQGHLGRAAEAYRGILQAAGPRIDPNVVAAHLNLGNVLYEWYRLEESEQHLQISLDLSEQMHLRDATLFSLLWLARVKRARGDREEAAALLRRAEFELRDFPESIVQEYASAVMARLALADGRDPESILRKPQGLPVDPLPGTNLFFRKLEYLTQARLLLQRGEWNAAGQFLDRLAAAADSAGLAGSQVEILALQALACLDRGDGAGAAAALREAVKRGEPEGYVATFVELGAPMRELLRRISLPGVSSDYAARLASCLEKDRRPTAPAAALPGEVLSARELEVLRLVAAGKSNAQIARELVLATGTVKKHISNLCGKLGAQNRTECVARARARRLV